ncbi:hypothetical protein HUJ04_013569, partial [Dendroctonus ponderosae]
PHKEPLAEADETEQQASTSQESQTQFKGDNSKPKNSGKFRGKLRKYNEEYLQFEFIENTANDELRPQCVLCCDVLSNGSMKPAKLQRHLKRKHPESVNKSELTKRENVIERVASGNEKAALASFQTAELIVKSEKCHTIAEDLLLPAAQIMCKTMIGDSAAKQLHVIPLSNNTIKRRVTDLSLNSEHTLILRLQISKMFAIQFDESTDISNKAILLVFVLYDYDSEIHEDFLCLRELMRTTADCVFNALNDFFTESNIHTDGAHAMLGKLTGLVARVKSVALNITWTHCCIHREAIACKKCLHYYNQPWTKFPINSRVFLAICEEVGNEHVQLLLHTEQFWIKINSDFNEFSEKAIKYLIPFRTTYLCEQTFSVYVLLKSKQRNRLDAASDIRLKISNIRRDLRKIMMEKPVFHSSH